MRPRMKAEGAENILTVFCIVTAALEGRSEVAEATYAAATWILAVAARTQGAGTKPKSACLSDQILFQAAVCVIQLSLHTARNRGWFVTLRCLLLQRPSFHHHMLSKISGTFELIK